MLGVWLANEIADYVHVVFVVVLATEDNLGCYGDGSQQELLAVVEKVQLLVGGEEGPEVWETVLAEEVDSLIQLL